MSNASTLFPVPDWNHSRGIAGSQAKPPLFRSYGDQRGINSTSRFVLMHANTVWTDGRRHPRCVLQEVEEACSGHLTDMVSLGASTSFIPCEATAEQLAHRSHERWEAETRADQWDSPS